MVCPITQRRFVEFSSSLERLSIEGHLPYTGVLELTYRCNQACRHCYCNLGLNDPKKDEELSLAEVKRILDEIAEAGCLWLLFTGGEILIREDFWDIYLYTLKKGIMVEIFSNGSLITEETAKRFLDNPPLGIEITIYGSTPGIHDNIARNRGSFAKTMKGLEYLLKYNVPVSLKTMLMSLNYADLPNMQRLGRELKVDVKFDALICQRLDGDISPLSYRLPAQKVVEIELQEERDFIGYKEIFADFWKRDFGNDAFICSAGLNAFNINPYGVLSPCTMYLSYQYPLREVSFKKAWDKLGHEYNNINDSISPGCKSCPMVFLCPNCPAWAELETKKLDGQVDYLCQYTLNLEKEVKDGEEALSEARD